MRKNQPRFLNKFWPKIVHPFAQRWPVLIDRLLDVDAEEYLSFLAGLMTCPETPFPQVPQVPDSACSKCTVLVRPKSVGFEIMRPEELAAAQPQRRLDVM